MELPFDDGEVLNADDPRPQRVTQYPTEVRRVPPKRPEQEAIPTTVYQIPQDEAFRPSYDAREVTDPGYKPAFLYVEKGPGQGQLVPVKQGSLVIGRASVSELRLQHPSVSRRHAQITRLGERFYLKDLGSQNGTYVNKVKIETEIEIYPGDQIQVGSAVLKLRGPAERVPEIAKKQMEKAAARSARRLAVAPEAGSRGPNKLLLGLACAAVGFGAAAVLLFVVLNLTNQEPSHPPLPVAQPVAAGAPEPSSAPAATTEPPRVADPVAERIQREMAERRAAAPAPAPEAEPVEAVAAEPVHVARAETSAATIARREVKPASHRVDQHSRSAVEEDDADDEDSAPAASTKKAGADSAQVLKLYEGGDVSAAIALAKAAGDEDLASKLTDFQTYFAAGEKAEKAGDGTGAIKAYQKALAADEKISGGWGKHGPAISKKLGNLYTLVGQYYLREDDEANARLAFEAALKYDPANGTAKKHLAPLQSEAGATASRPKAKAAAEDAWGDEEEKPAAPRPSRSAKSAIEDAWND